MEHISPRRATANGLKATIGGIALITLVACTSAPAAGPQETPQTVQATEATEATHGTEVVETPTGVVRTAFPDLEPAGGEPELASIADARPAVGEAVQAAGPFDQRLVLEDLTFDGAAVSGKVTVTSDISELLALQVLAGFYDDDGELLGTDRFDLDPGAEHTHGGGAEPETFRIEVPAEFADRAVSAAVGVPVLVNE